MFNKHYTKLVHLSQGDLNTGCQCLVLNIHYTDTIILRRSEYRNQDGAGVCPKQELRSGRGGGGGEGGYDIQDSKCCLTCCEEHITDKQGLISLPFQHNFITALCCQQQETFVVHCQQLASSALHTGKEGICQQFVFTEFTTSCEPNSPLHVNRIHHSK